jgi:hypothetical protein
MVQTPDSPTESVKVHPLSTVAVNDGRLEAARGEEILASVAR